MDLSPETDLHFTRTVPVPAALVFECWTKPEHIANFFVPRPNKVTGCDIDLRVGGRFNTTFDVEGNVMENKGVYLDIVPNEKLVFTDTYSEGWKPAAEPFMTAILLLKDNGDGTCEYTAIARHRSAETAKQHEQMGFYDGWGTVADQLIEYAQSLMAKRT